jgi:hypothetical protein
MARESFFSKLFSRADKADKTIGLQPLRYAFQIEQV